MKEQALDLELLRFFSAMLEHGSLGKTAASLGMSPSSASRALERLRHIFDDRLFLKSNPGMVLTPRAELLAPNLKCALAQMEALVSPVTFDPAKSTRLFFIAAAGNAVSASLIPALPRFLAEAPHARINLRAPGTDLFERLRDGRLDVALYAGSAVPTDCHSIPIRRFSFSLVMRRDHPLTLKARVGETPSESDIAQYRRLILHVQGGIKSHNMETECGADLPGDKVAIHTEYSFIGPLALLENDLIAILPSSIADRLSELGVWASRPAPGPMREMHINLIWHHRVHNDAAVLWLRRLLIDSATDNPPVASQSSSAS